MEKNTVPLEKITGVKYIPSRLNQTTTDVTAQNVQAIMSNMERVEGNKDKLDFKPSVDFVDQNFQIYQQAVNSLLTREKSKSGLKLAAETTFFGVDDIVEPQVNPEEAGNLLAIMPESLVKLSMLQNISYHLFGEHIKKIPVPGFDEEGNFDPKKVELVSVDEFPRPHDHPTRILVGVSNGRQIFPTPIPSTVSSNSEAIKFFQIHVFLHEFFHTIERLRRDPEKRSQILLEIDRQQFTFQDWWKAFEELLVSGIEPEAISNYAETYSHQLNEDFAKKEEGKFTAAVAEQIAETFVAYMLGIISNKKGWTNFKTESFGNTNQLEKYLKGEAPAANLKWILMDQLCRAKVIKSETTN